MLGIGRTQRQRLEEAEIEAKQFLRADEEANVNGEEGEQDQRLHKRSANMQLDVGDRAQQAVIGRQPALDRALDSPIS